jgi:hypothetical protein
MALNRPIGDAMAEQVIRVNGNKSSEQIINEQREQIAQMLADLSRMKARAEYWMQVAKGDLSPSLPPPDERDYLTVKEVMAKTGASHAKVCRWCLNRKVKARKVKPPVGVEFWAIEKRDTWPNPYER